VAVEKVHFPRKRPKFRESKMSRDPKTSYSREFGEEEFFQPPQAIVLKTPAAKSTSTIAILQQLPGEA